MKNLIQNILFKKIVSSWQMLPVIEIYIRNKHIKPINILNWKRAYNKMIIIILKDHKYII